MFVVRSMEPMCPVIAIGQTPEEAWAACDAAGVARDRAIVERSPVARLDEAFAVVDDAKRLRLELYRDASGLEMKSKEVHEARETIRDLKKKLAATIETVKSAKDEAEA